MRKLVIIVLAVTVVFGMSAVAMAEAGSLEGGNELDGTVDIEVTVDKYGEVKIMNEDSYFADDNGDPTGVLGAPGIYSNDGSIFQEYLQDNVWTSKNWTHHHYGNGSGSGLDEANLGKFKILANTDVNAELTFDDTGWLDSETVIGIWDRDGSAQYVDYFGTAAGVNSSATINNIELDHEYDLMAGFLIEEIDQQTAGDYSGEVTITISAM